QRSKETGLRLSKISHKNLQGKTQKAVKIYKLFEKLTNDKVQEIIDNFSEQNPKELYHMSPKDESSIPEISAGGLSQNHVTKKILS
ncbi:13362_t:CDS:2, partial [Funneliformis geosporum]